MPSDYDNSLLREAIINIKANDYSLARRYLERAIDMADDRDTCTWANYWMSQISTDPVEKRKFLEEALANDPMHPEARKALAILDGKIRPADIVDPDALPAQSQEPQKSKADRFTCPKCGARMVFDGDGRTLICEHCSRNQVLGDSKPEFEQDFILAMATGKGHRTPVAVKVFNCQGCGARFVLPPQEISVVCAYCGSPHVVIGDSEMVEPDSIIPAAFNQRQAALFMVKWVQQRKIKPERQVLPPRGMYLPVWTFDIMGLVPWNGTIYRDKRKVPVSGEKNVSFNDIPVPGAAKMADLLPRILPGYDIPSAVAYDPRYLSGWPAEFFELSMSDASLEARKKAVQNTRSQINSEMGHISDLNYSTSNLTIMSFKLVLIPIWYTTYLSGGKEFRIAINGQNGKVHGESDKVSLVGWLEDMLGA